MSGKKKKEKSRSGRRIVTQAVMRQQGKKHRRARGTGGQEWIRWAKWFRGQTSDSLGRTPSRDRHRRTNAVRRVNQLGKKEGEHLGRTVSGAEPDRLSGLNGTTSQADVDQCRVPSWPLGDPMRHLSADKYVSE